MFDVPSSTQNFSGPSSLFFQESQPVVQSASLTSSLKSQAPSSSAGCCSSIFSGIKNFFGAILSFFGRLLGCGSVSEPSMDKDVKKALERLRAEVLPDYGVILDARDAFLETLRAKKCKDQLEEWKHHEFEGDTKKMTDVPFCECLDQLDSLASYPGFDENVRQAFKACRDSVVCLSNEKELSPHTYGDTEQLHSPNLAHLSNQKSRAISGKASYSASPYKKTTLESIDQCLAFLNEVDFSAQLEKDLAPLQKLQIRNAPCVKALLDKKAKQSNHSPAECLHEVINLGHGRVLDTKSIMNVFLPLMDKDGLNKLADLLLSAHNKQKIRIHADKCAKKFQDKALDQTWVKENIGYDFTMEDGENPFSGLAEENGTTLSFAQKFLVQRARLDFKKRFPEERGQFASKLLSLSNGVDSIYEAYLFSAIINKFIAASVFYALTYEMTIEGLFQLFGEDRALNEALDDDEEYENTELVDLLSFRFDSGRGWKSRF